MIFQELSITGNCLRSETAPLTTLDIKRGLLCNFAKNFKDCHFMVHNGTDFQLLLNSKSSKLPLIVFWKYVKNTYFGPKKKGPFFQIFL